MMIDGLVLSAGSTRCAYGAGYLLGLRNRYPGYKDGLRNIIACSGNSPNAAALLAGQEDACISTWHEEVSSREFMWKFPTPGINISYLVNVLKGRLDFGKILSSDAKLLISATNLSTLEPVYFANKDAGASKEYLCQALRASMSPPFYADDDVKVGDISCSDGELTATTVVNIQKAIDEGSRNILVIYNADEEYGWLIESYLKFKNRQLYDRVMHSNKRPVKPENCTANVMIVKPSRELPLRAMTDNNKARIRDTIDIGYDDAWKISLDDLIAA